MIISNHRRCFLLLICMIALIVTTGESSADSRIEAIGKYSTAIEAWNLENYGLALFNFEEAQRLFVYPDFHYNVAACYDLLKQYNEALNHYNIYVELHPQGKAADFVRNRINEIRYAPIVKAWKQVNAMMDGPREYGWVEVRQPPFTTFYLYSQDWMY